MLIDGLIFHKKREAIANDTILFTIARPGFLDLIDKYDTK